jgi:pimeloyl-ACP methyl ester carboxylesterase
LLINGIGAALEMWKPLTSGLSGRELISFDLPGCGRSPAPSRPMRMRAVAALVTTLLDRLGHQRVDILGYSFGGAVAQELAYRSPDYVERLILCATTPGIPSLPPNPLIATMMLSPLRYYSESLGSFMVRHIAGGRTAREPEVLQEGLRQRLAMPPSLLGYTQQLITITGWSSQPWLRHLRPETLVIHGDDDPVAPLFNARRMAGMIPRARLEVIAGGGHLFLLDQPDDALAVIDDFLG